MRSTEMAGVSLDWKAMETVRVFPASVSSNVMLNVGVATTGTCSVLARIGGVGLERHDAFGARGKEKRHDALERPDIVNHLFTQVKPAQKGFLSFVRPRSRHISRKEAQSPFALHPLDQSVAHGVGDVLKELLADEGDNPVLQREMQASEMRLVRHTHVQTAEEPV